MARDTHNIEIEQDTVEVRILRRAIKIWKNPMRRARGFIRKDARDGKDSYCAIGVLGQAQRELGTSYYEGWEKLLGFKNTSVINANDLIGCWYIYHRMKKKLKELQNQEK
jgi:hypothetical protein